MDIGVSTTSGASMTGDESMTSGASKAADFSICGTGRLSGSGSFSVDFWIGTCSSSKSFSINLSPLSASSFVTGI